MVDIRGEGFNSRILVEWGVPSKILTALRVFRAAKSRAHV